MTPQLYHRFSLHSTAAILVETGNHKVGLSATDKPRIDANNPRNLRMRIQALMTDDCWLHQYTRLGKLFDTLSF